MFDVWHGDIELTSLVIVFSAIFILPIQLLLCFKSNKTIVRLIPMVILGSLLLLFTVLRFITVDWSALFYLICSVFCLIMLAFSAIGWSIWAIITKTKK